MRKQRAFATLTEEEINQIADWLRHEKYEEVRERVNKPRPEGFGLIISIGPLQTLYRKTNEVREINSHLEAGEKLTVTKLDAILSGDQPASEKAHNAIMEATHEMATSGENTATQLLSLQRLADFPARVEIREQRLELDHQKLDHKLEMDTFRKDMAEKRFDFAQKTFAFRQQVHQDNLTLALQRKEKKSNGKLSPYPPGEDALGPLPTSFDDLEAIGKRARKFFNISDEESARRKALFEKYESGELRAPDHCGFYYPGSPFGSTPPAAPTTPAPAAPCSGDFQPAVAPSAPKQSEPLRDAPSETVPSISHFEPRTSNFSSPSASSALSALNSSSDSRNLKSEICDLQSTVDSYTVKRAREYWAYRRKISSGYPTDTHPDYITQYRHCPCGNATPCPIHENEETYGRFPDWFWTRSPHSFNYADCLRSRDLPYRDPKEFL
jgi:hypothetical protein